MFNLEKDLIGNAKIKVIGVGGGGNNTINRMIEEQVRGVEFICVNTDAQALKNCGAHENIHIGVRLTKGLGAGANPEIGSKALLESLEAVQDVLKDTDMLFITAGMGGGTGTGAAPEIAKIAKEMGILTVGVVTTPFKFEGKKRMKNADHGLSRLVENVDTLITVSNEKLLSLTDKKISLSDAFKTADSVVTQGIHGISDLISVPGIINLDFADVKTTMTDKGVAYMGMGYAKGENRAIDAVKNALENPLVEKTIEGATGVILNIAANQDLGLFEVNECAGYISEYVHEDANIIFGASVDERMEEYVQVTIIATGFQEE